jgi:hypothetical protein
MKFPEANGIFIREVFFLAPDQVAFPVTGVER